MTKIVNVLYDVPIGGSKVDQDIHRKTHAVWTKIYRYREEKFVILLPEIDKERARVMAKRIRSLIEQEKFEGEESQPNKKVIVSIGISSYPSDTSDKESLTDLLALRFARQRNWVETEFVFLRTNLLRYQRTTVGSEIPTELW